MNDFRFSCYRLLHEYPMVNYRIPAEQDRNELRVILIGSGYNLNTLFNQVLTQGQLIDTNLIITVITQDAVKAANRLRGSAPEIENYTEITSGKFNLNPKFTDDMYAHISFLTIPKKLKAISDLFGKLFKAGNSYVIISTGDDELNTSYADAAASVFKEGSLIAYEQNTEPDARPASGADIFAFGYQNETDFLKYLNRVAYNLHYSYTKIQNNRATREQIDESYVNKYNHIATLENALNIRGKLVSCGITSTDDKTAADEFARLIQEHPAILKKLSYVEHRRWMMEKILKGYTQMKDLSMIYSGPGVSSHDDNEKWHICIIPCDDVSELKPEHWKMPLKTAAEQLDELDILSLRVHSKCGQIANERRPEINKDLFKIRGLVERIFLNDDVLIAAARSMELAISQMWQKKRSAEAIYEGNLRLIREACAKETSSEAASLTELLEALNYKLLPLKEFISFKDYKAQNEILIRQIPFAMTHKRRSTVVKLIAEKESDCLFSTRQLEPKMTVFIGIVYSISDYFTAIEKVSTIYRYVKESYPSLGSEYHLLVPTKILKIVGKKIDMDAPAKVIRHELKRPNQTEITAIMNEILSNVSADYIDVTNCDPQLFLATRGANIPLIAHKLGRFLNISNAPEVVYPAPSSTITVKEMFALSGTYLVEESDSSVLSDLSTRYKKFFNLAMNASNWDAFCKYIAGVSKAQHNNALDLPPLKRSDKFYNKSFTVNEEIARALAPAFSKFERHNYIKNLSITNETDAQKTFSFEFFDDARGDELLSKISRCVEAYTPTTTYKVNNSISRPEISYTDLLIRDMELPGDKSKEFSHILKVMASNDLLTDFVCDKNKGTYSFQFATKDVLAVMQTSGKVLEYYLYYTALLDANFDDVEMGWHFRNSSDQDAANNELDIICTKGNSSLFISAKMISGIKEANYLNYVIYEISLMAERFGLNPKTALAIPAVDQFQLNKDRTGYVFSKEVKAAYGRGVYLLGKECFKNDVLGEVLDRISEGRDDWCDWLKPKI